MSADADDVIAEIDAATISPMTHFVTRSLYRHIPLQDELERKIVNAFDGGSQAKDMAVLESALWAKIDKSDVERQGA